MGEAEPLTPPSVPPDVVPLLVPSLAPDVEPDVEEDEADFEAGAEDDFEFDGLLLVEVPAAGELVFVGLLVGFDWSSPPCDWHGVLAGDGVAFAVLVAFGLPLADVEVLADAVEAGELDAGAEVVVFAVPVLGLTGGLADSLPPDELDVAAGVDVADGLLVFGDVMTDVDGEAADVPHEDAAAGWRPAVVVAAVLPPVAPAPPEPADRPLPWAAPAPPLELWPVITEELS